MTRPYWKLRLTDEKVAWKATRVIDMWKVTRQMSKHVPRAILMYKALLDNDYNLFIDMLVEVAPRIAVKLLQQSLPVDAPPAPPTIPKPQRAESKAKASPPPAPTFIEPIDETDSMDALAKSLGLDGFD